MTFSPQGLPLGIDAPNGANFRKQYLPTSVFLNKEDSLFFLRSLAQQMTEDEILQAREKLGINDEQDLVNKFVTIPVMEQPTYNGFFVEMDIQRDATITTTGDSDGDATAGETMVGGTPANVTIKFSDVTKVKPRMTVLDKTTLGVYQVQSVNETDNTLVLRLVAGGTYSSTGNFPPTFTNSTTGLAIAQSQEFLIMAGNVEHGAQTAIDNEPGGVSIRQFRVQTDYEKFGKTYQGLKEEGSQLIRELDYDRRLQQCTYDMFERLERTLHYNKGDDVTINGNRFLYTDGVLDTIGTETDATALGTGALTPDLDTFNDIIADLRSTGGLNDYVLCVGTDMANVVSSLNRTETNYRIMKSEGDKTIGSNFNNIVGTFGGVDVVYNPQMNHALKYRESIVALKKSNVILSTVSNAASIELHDRMNIEGEGILKLKRNIQNNQELNVYDGMLAELAVTLVHPTTHRCYKGFTSVSS